jgi:hypothetical protein
LPLQRLELLALLALGLLEALLQLSQLLLELLELSRGAGFLGGQRPAAQTQEQSPSPQPLREVIAASPVNPASRAATLHGKPRRFVHRAVGP